MSSCGFDSLPNQVTVRHTIHGSSFNVLVVGPTGIGKTTLINSLFDCDYPDSPDLEREVSDVSLRVKEYRPPNKTIDIKLTIIETKGFNNQLDKTHSYQPIVDYITARYEDYLQDELKVQTKYNDISDNRVHCCIYMISPTGSGLKPIDLITMKQLHKRVCLIPVIGKSDILTKQERLAFKERVRQEITLNEIEIYPSEDPLLPLAIAASNEIFIENGKKQRVRPYPWGRMYIEKDSEFSKLRDLVLRSNMLSLVGTTNRVHYEKYRRESNSKDTPKKELEDFMRKYELEKTSMLRECRRLEQEVSLKTTPRKKPVSSIFPLVS